MKLQNAVRKNALLNFGFGIDVMRERTVCQNCSSLESSHRSRCSKCNAKLPKTSLYSLYKSKHDTCSQCGQVISRGMHYCPHCGDKLLVSNETSVN